MRVQLTCFSVDSGVIRKGEREGEKYTTAVFLDTDPEDKLSAFLKYSGDDVSRIIPGETYVISLTGLTPAKGDKSSYYIRGRLLYDESKRTSA